ncbi:MAG TPA: DNA-binding response regulator, partial [Cytophagales bacterium]|nr:DNA-binding response regulator [Cytophagales bacterium]
QIHVVGTADSVASALSLLRETEPEVLFLDIQLEQEQSFALLEQVEPTDYHIIFVTAYTEYALEAFDSAAIDYLLKPINPLRLQKAVQKVLRQPPPFPASTDWVQQLADCMTQQAPARKKILLKERDVVHLVPTDDILWVEARGSYTTFFLQDGSHLMVSKHLKEYEDTLQAHSFYRVHRSYLVNVHKIEKIDRSEGNVLYMEGGHQVQVSVRRKEQLLELLRRITEG